MPPLPPPETDRLTRADTSKTQLDYLGWFWGEMTVEKLLSRRRIQERLFGRAFATLMSVSSRGKSGCSAIPRKERKSRAFSRIP